MAFTLIRYDAARKALSSAHRIDEVKKIHDKAAALLAYARQAGDYELQNKAAEIRIFAERRAGQLLIALHQTGQRRTKERGRPTKVSSATTLPKLGITRDQSSKWQRMARLIDDATFDRALSQAKDVYGELTTAGVIRAVKAVMKPVSRIVEANASVLADALLRDIESSSRGDKLKAVVETRERLNPTLRKKLMVALNHAAEEYASAAANLADGYQEFPNDGKATQRHVREHMAKQPEPDLKEKKRLAKSLDNASIREISYDDAKQVILGHEWLATMGTSEFSFGLFFGKHLAGVVCFGSTAGSQTASSVCGEEHRHKVATISRGASVFWAHPHSGSHLISAACRLMTKKGYNVFVSYSDPDANEIGTLYSAVNHAYCGLTQASEQFRMPDGTVHDSRQVSGLARDRSGGTLKYRRTRAEQKAILIEQGAVFFRGTPKHRFVGFYGDRRQKRILRNALQWQVLPYPKRQTIG